MVAALFVDPAGVYPSLVGPTMYWELDRDARRYHGPHPVVAHPPCNLWVNMAAVNYKRATAKCPSCKERAAREKKPGWTWQECACQGTGFREPNRSITLPAWYPGGSDDGCFASALRSVRRWGGVLEHPMGTHAWLYYGLRMPGLNRELEEYRAVPGGWEALGGVYDGGRAYVCEVWQSAYGHPARKRTWLYYVGHRAPFELNWSREPGTHQIGWFDRNKPTLSKRAASATPEAFARELIRLAEWSRG